MAGKMQATISLNYEHEHRESGRSPLVRILHMAREEERTNERSRERESEETKARENGIQGEQTEE